MLGLVSVAGVRVHAAVGGIGRGGAGEDAEGFRHMRSFERVLHSSRCRDRPWICGLPFPRVLLPAVGFPGRLLHHQGLSVSSLDMHSICFSLSWPFPPISASTTRLGETKEGRAGNIMFQQDHRRRVAVV